MEKLENQVKINMAEILPNSECTKKDNRRINQRIKYAMEHGSPINFYVGTCPDYSNDESRYTFESIGNGVPLLTKKQIVANESLFNSMGYLWLTI